MTAGAGPFEAFAAGPRRVPEGHPPVHGALADLTRRLRGVLPVWAVDALLIGIALLEALLTLYGGSPLETGLSVLAASGLVLRGRWPFVSLLLVLPALVFGCATVAMVVALYSVAARSQQAWLIGLGALLVFAAYVSFAVFPASPDQWALSIIYGLLLAGGPVALGLLATTRQDLAERIDQLRAAHAEQRELATRAVLARERAVLAREMHDVVSHQVSLIAVQAGALQVRADDEQVRETARTIRGLSVGTLEELRTMVAVLRAAGGATREVQPQPRASDLSELVERSGLDVQADIDLPSTLPMSVQRAVYRAAQESLTNVRKHAPGAAVRLRVERLGAMVRLTVRNGPARETIHPLPGSGIGLVGLSERAHLLGGTLDAGPTDGGGFALRFTVPAGG